jgi:rhodanese-related sulfurtransferase
MVTLATRAPTDAHHDPHIGREELRARLYDAGLTVLNVMPRETFADSHIPNSINLPVGEIEARAREMLPDLTQEIAIYCAGPT